MGLPVHAQGFKGWAGAKPHPWPLQSLLLRGTDLLSAPPIAEYVLNVLCHAWHCVPLLLSAAQ